MDLLKFLIADDEENIRSGLKHIIDWEKCGYKFCGEASNGKNAVSQIIDLQPDLVILDIKMPGLTGIEVLSQVSDYYSKNKLPFPAFIILSGFSEFEYAKDALNKGAKSYLLKPVDEDLLEKTVISIAEEIREKRSLNAVSLNAKKLETMELLDKLIHEGNKESVNRIIDDSFFDESENSSYMSVIFFMKYFFAGNADYENLKKTVSNNFLFFKKIIQIYDNKILLIIKTSNEKAVYNCLERISSLYKNRTFITSSEYLNGLDGIIDSFKQAISLEKYLFYVSDKKMILNSDPKEEGRKLEDGDFKNYINEQINKMIFCIETYSKETMAEKFDELEKFFCNPAYSESETKKNLIYTLLELRNRLVIKYPEREISVGSSYDVVPHILEKITFEDSFLYFKQVLTDFLEDFNFNTADSVIVKVLSYVNINYAQDLKLEALGSMFNCNSAYLGKKFKKKTGVQFNTYLDNLRIEEAKDKILHTDLKIYQISKLVGYTNTDYFFMKFKKYTGMTPKEFKKVNDDDKKDDKVENENIENQKSGDEKDES